MDTIVVYGTGDHDPVTCTDLLSWIGRQSGRFQSGIAAKVTYSGDQYVLAGRVLILWAEPADVAARLFLGAFLVECNKAEEDVFVAQVHGPAMRSLKMETLAALASSKVVQVAVWRAPLKLTSTRNFPLLDRMPDGSVGYGPGYRSIGAKAMTK